MVVVVVVVVEVVVVVVVVVAAAAAAAVAVERRNSHSNSASDSGIFAMAPVMGFAIPTCQLVLFPTRAWRESESIRALGRSE